MALLLASLNGEENVHHFYVECLMLSSFHLPALLKRAVKSERTLGVEGKIERGRGSRQEQIVRTDVIKKA